MIELKNSKTTYLGRASGGDKYSLDAFIGAVQMREPGGQWQDIQPQLVREAGGWHIEGAPYRAEVKDDGTRLFCPDRNERSRYLCLPAPALFSGIDKNLMTNPGKLDGIHRPNQITMPADWGEYRIIFTNTGMKFEILFTKAPPANLFGKDSPRILLDAEGAGFDIGQLLKAHSGIGIPKPRLIMASQETIADESQERWLDWSYKNGQLELGFDFGDLPFPLLLKNTSIDLQVGASLDDGEMCFDVPFANNTYGNFLIGDGTYDGYGGMARFALAIPKNAVIDTAHQSYRELYSKSATVCNARITAEDVDNAGAYSNDWATESARYANHTTEVVDWNNLAAMTAGIWYDSPEIKTLIQAIVNRSGWVSGNYIGLYAHDFDYRSDSGAHRQMHSYDSDSASSPKLHIEYTAGGATPKTAAETGSGADVSSLLATMAKAESGGGADAAEIIAGLLSGETGLGVDIGMIVGLKQLFSGDGGTSGDALKALINTSGSGSDMKLPGRQGRVGIPSRGVSL